MTLVPELRMELLDVAQRRVPHRPRRWRAWNGVHRGRALAAGGGASVCLIGVVVALLVSATSSAPPAYALTPHADGSYTLRLYTLSQGIPQLNAKLRSLGIDETVVPMIKGCPHAVPAYPVNGQLSITLRPDHYDLAPGDQGFIAARMLSGGRVSYAQGAMPQGQIPACFGTTPVVIHTVSSAGG